MTAKNPEDIIFSDLNTQEVRTLSTYDSEVLAAVLVFVMAELIIQQDPKKKPTREDFVKTVQEAGSAALAMVEEVYKLGNKQEGTEKVATKH